MRILLDENFPLPLYRRLLDTGLDAEHIIVSGQRGLPDSAIRKRLETEDLVFLTNDTEFLADVSALRALVVVSRVRQDRPLRERVDLWLTSLLAFLRDRPEGTIFELFDSGEVVPWTVIANP